MNENQTPRDYPEPEHEARPEDLNELIKDLTVEPEILEELSSKNCLFCGVQMQESFSFCTHCGREQILPEPEKELPGKVLRSINPVRPTVVPKKSKQHPVAFAFSIVFFSFSLIALIAGIIKMLWGYAPSVSIFGSDSTPVIFNGAVMVSCFLMSILFSLLGIFLFYIKKD